MTSAEDPEGCAIGIDCKPGELRPDTLLPIVLRGTSLRVRDFHPPDKVFGACTWHLKQDPYKEAIFLVSRALFQKRLLSLIETKKARGALLSPSVYTLRVVRTSTKEIPDGPYASGPVGCG